ncbi:hypothetical protein P43SY_004207 [Pythium insidiosum]|uniref:CSC1/OSCA1-like cytosolic domain-containing protein n=1 Tax=Pythium insidiosum TaxID=114742 RepID=A0AAD5LCF3_PYTIN|nr:hypothetical protein P43SY_004207 [Pythium insidiosum]
MRDSLTRRRSSLAAESLDKYDAKPSVAVAKQWFETAILPRRVLDAATGRHRLVEMGEEPVGSELFPVWATSLQDLTAFGIGIGLYFRMLVTLGALFALLSLVSLPTMTYFVSDAYSGRFDERRASDNSTLDPRIWGSAVCTRTRNATLEDGTVVGVNDCPLHPRQLYQHFVVLVVIGLYVVISGFVQSRTTAFIDAQEQTAADYAVVIKDPDEDAWDPSEWKAFCEQFGRVKFVTVAVDNHELLSLLAHKRYMEEMLRMETTDPQERRAALKAATTAGGALLPPRPPAWKRALQRFSLCRDLTYWQHEIHATRARLQALLKARRDRGFPVWTVFVMFETEDAQRRCLREMTAGLCATITDCASASAVPEHVRFRGTNILRVEDPVEPSSVNWKHVGVRRGPRLLQQALISAVVVAMMVGVYHLMRALKGAYVNAPGLSLHDRRFNLFLVAYALAATDLVGCYVIYYVQFLEMHQFKEREQLSYLNKLLLFRCYNSAVVIYLLMDFTEILEPVNLLQIQAVLIANLTTTPVLQLLCPGDRLFQWCLGPFAKTQKKLNLYYSGMYWQLAERYTEITKTVGIALFFNPLLPTGLLVTALSLVVNYWVDKYCLLRLWKVPPQYDGLLARASRYHLLLLCMASLVMTGHWFNGWPFDAATLAAMKSQPTLVLRGAVGRQISHWLNGVLPFPRQSYATKTQGRMIRAVFVLIFVLLAVSLLVLVLHVLWKAWRRFISGRAQSQAKRYQATSERSVPCSQVPHLNAYVPTYESWYSDFPYLSVDLREFDAKFISWTGAHADYCLVNDVVQDAELGDAVAGVPLERLFGTCKQFDVPSDDQNEAV